MKKGLKMRFEINEDLRKKIVSKIPEGATKMQACMIVYAELCRTLEYSMEYYVLEKTRASFYTDCDNLKQIDGVNRKDVTCFTFDAIFQEIVEGLGFEGVKFIDQFYFQPNGWFKNTHHVNLLMIDGLYCEVDATLGVLDNNDLVDMKYAGQRIQGFFVSVLSLGEEKRTKVLDEYQAGLNMIEQNEPLNSLALEYLELKADDYKKLPIEERFNLFMNLLKQAPEYSITSLNYILKLKGSLFLRSEASIEETARKQYVSISFVREQNTKELRVIIMFNPDGHRMNDSDNNFDNLQIYEYKLKDGELVKHKKEDFARKIKGAQYFSVGTEYKPLSKKISLAFMIEGYKDL